MKSFTMLVMPLDSPVIKAQPTSHSLSVIIKAAMIAGLVAGLSTAVFHFFVTEPVLDQAIALEEQHTPASDPEPPSVSRDAQKGGLFLGYLLYGLSYSALFALVYHLMQRQLPGHTVMQKALALAFLAYLAIGLLPFLKYPADPPGVGDPATIAYRLHLYLGFLCLAILAIAVTTTMTVRLARRVTDSGMGKMLIVLASLIVCSGLLLYFMPAVIEAGDVPEGIVENFRARSIIGITLFWAVFGVGFGWALRALVVPKSLTSPVE